MIDISHTINDGYSISDIVSILEGRNVTGLHLSDAIANVEVRKGTHLPVGEGEVDFAEVLRTFRGPDKVYGALEIKGMSGEIRDSLCRLKA